MKSMSIFIQVILLLTIHLARECRGAKITTFNVPSYFDLHNDENKDLPLVLKCDYEFEKGEKGVVLKWLHNSLSIYQWIDTTKSPTILSKAFKNRIDLNYFNELPPKERYSNLVIKNPTISDSGNWTCDIQSFQSLDRKTAPMQVVYIDESIDFSAQMDSLDDEVTFECAINQIYPLPEIAILIAGNELKNSSSLPELKTITNVYHNVTYSVKVKRDEIEDDTEVTCVLKIPEIDYERRKTITYDDPYKSVPSVTNMTIIGDYMKSDDENNGHLTKPSLLLSLVMSAVLSIIKSTAF